jgi:hypothetical protein
MKRILRFCLLAGCGVASIVAALPPPQKTSMCVLGCVRAGSPLAILTKDGDLYLPISDKMPDYDQRQKLMPFVGKYVRATGIVFERNGTRAIVITEIAEMKEVHVTIDQE